MPSIFGDTSGWGHLVDPSQSYHEQAADLYRRAREEGHRFVTTNYILTELVALLTSPLRTPRPRTIAFVASLKSSPFVDVVHVDATLDAQAWQLLVDRPDKDWSLVDCASFVVMQKNKLIKALTTDPHFEQAGFVRLLKR
ncbi:MAG TPA: PIN domain-containing protein [Thermoanaerobaculia bacterium]|jgi:predicted nucleic acid-binding protein|nr:PIN domain-containing protein [Thermoanaerobaculia bacterium]